MARRRTSGSIQDLGGGRKRVMVSAKPDPITGKRRRLSRVVEGGMRTAERALDALKAEAGSVPQAHGLTLRSYIEDMWYPHLEERKAQGKLRQKTIEGYKSKVDKHVTPHLGSLMLPEIDPYTLDRWLGRLASNKVSQHTRHHVYRVLHAALQQAVKWRLTAGNPLDAVDDPGTPANDVTVLTLEEANRVLDAFIGHLIEPLVVLALATGMRRSELAALDWADIDFTVGTVSTWRGLHQHGERMWFEDNKTERSKRTVALPPWALEMLKARRGLGPIVTDGDRRIMPDKLSYLFRSQLKKAGLRDIPLRDLRHSHATIALAQGVELTVLSRRLGHSTVTTTDRFYLRPGLAADIDAAAKIEGMRITNTGS